MSNFIQINLNRSRYARDLMAQYLVERKIGIAYISEPGAILVNNPFGRYSGNDLAAIFWSPSFTRLGS